LIEQLGKDYSRVVLSSVCIYCRGRHRFGAKNVFALGLLLMAAGGLMTGVGAAIYLIAIGRFVSGTGGHRVSQCQAS